MSKKYIKLTEEDYKNIRDCLTYYIGSYENIEELTIGMSIDTIDKIEYYLKAPIHLKLFGTNVMLYDIEENVIVLDYNDTKDKARYMNPYPYIFNYYGNFTKEKPTLPDKYIVNQDACILFYGNNKTIVKRHVKDRKDPVKAFLWAYFLRHTGMSRTKANKYLKKVHDDYINNIKDTLK